MTATINNKSVFELAQSKGYIPTDYTLNENGFHGYLSEDQYYLEMCFIQKWLRITRKIYVTVEYYKPSYRDTFSWKSGVLDMENLKINYSPTQYLGQTFEMALTHGINEALQLI